MRAGRKIRRELRIRRFIAEMVMIFLVLTGVLPLAGCGAEAGNTVSWGQWLTMLDNAFGMESYTMETPYFNSVDSQNPYFAAVQTAAEWDVISPEEEMDVNGSITWREVMVTLVNAGNFIAADASEEEKLKYAKEYFYTEFRDYWLDRDITEDKAIFLLGIAQEQWAGLKYDHVIENITYKEAVKDFTREERCITDYTVLENGVIAIPLEHAVDIQQGDVYVLPPNEQSMGISAYQAERVYSDDHFLFIQNKSEELQLEDIAENLFVEESYMPTMENTVIYDGNGNLLSVGSSVSPYVVSRLSNSSEYEISDLVYRSGNTTLVNTASPKVSHTFTIDGCEVSLEYKLNGAFDMKASVTSENILKSKNQGSLKLEGSVEISKLEVTNKIDWGFFKLKSALLKLDYEQKGKLSVSYKGTPIDKLVAPKNNGNGHFWSNFTRAIKSGFKDKDAKGAKTIKIGSMDIYSIGIARVCLDINLKLSVDGSLSIEVTEKGSKGLEYRDGNLRNINISDKSATLNLKGKLEFGIGIGPGLYTIGLKKQIIGLEVFGGVGGLASATMHWTDAENHLLVEMSESQLSPETCESVAGIPLYVESESIEEIAQSQGCTYKAVAGSNVQIHADVCVDLTGYFILRLQMTDYSYAADLLGGKIKTSWEIFGEKNAKFFNAHFENGVNVGTKWGNWSGDMCTVKYTPFDPLTEVTASPAAETDKPDAADDSVVRGENLLINEIKLNIGIGESNCILIQQLPEGYHMADIYYKTDNPQIVAVDGNGMVSGLSAGSAMVIVYSKDNRYKAYCAVTVLSNDAVTITPLNFNGDMEELISL